MNEEIRITAEAASKIPREALLQFLQGYGLEVVETLQGRTVRPAAQPRDYAEEAA